MIAFLHKWLMPTLVILVEGDSYVVLQGARTHVFSHASDLGRFLKNERQPHIIKVVLSNLELSSEALSFQLPLIFAPLLLSRHEKNIPQGSSVKWASFGKSPVHKVAARILDEERFDRFLKMLHQTNHRVADVFPLSLALVQWLKIKKLGDDALILLSHLEGLQVVRIQHGNILFDLCRPLAFIRDVIKHEQQQNTGIMIVNTTPHKLDGDAGPQIMQNLDKMDILRQMEIKRFGYIGRHTGIGSLLHSYRVVRIFETALIFSLLVLTSIAFSHVKLTQFSISTVSAQAAFLRKGPPSTVGMKLKTSHMIETYNQTQPRHSSIKSFHYDFRQNNKFD